MMITWTSTIRIIAIAINLMALINQRRYLFFIILIFCKFFFFGYVQPILCGNSLIFQILFKNFIDIACIWEKRTIMGKILPGINSCLKNIWKLSSIPYIKDLCSFSSFSNVAYHRFSMSSRLVFPSRSKK